MVRMQIYADTAAGIMNNMYLRIDDSLCRSLHKKKILIIVETAIITARIMSSGWAYMADTAAGMMIAMNSRVDGALRGHMHRKKIITIIEHVIETARVMMSG